MDYELASYEPAQRDDYLRLLQDAWGDDALTGAEFDWWFARNPAGSLMSVARDNGTVIGVASHSLYRMVLGGDERVASFSVHATTAPLFLGPLGWTEIARLRIWARAMPFGRKRATPVPQFRHAGDAAPDWPDHIVRDAAYLNWRYLDSPRDYVAYDVDGGYAVLGHKRHRGRDVALVADLVGPTRPLLRACLAGVRPETRLVFGVPARGQEPAYLACGFVPTPRSLHFMGKALAGTLDTDPRAWRFTLGDTDFF